MGTKKKRINLSVDESLYKELEEVKKASGELSLSSVVVDLAMEALELREDVHFSEMADKRENEDTLTHGEIWDT